MRKRTHEHIHGPRTSVVSRGKTITNGPRSVCDDHRRKVQVLNCRLNPVNPRAILTNYSGATSDGCARAPRTSFVSREQDNNKWTHAQGVTTTTGRVSPQNCRLNPVNPQEILTNYLGARGLHLTEALMCTEEIRPSDKSLYASLRSCVKAQGLLLGT
jgi:hypothetical protein